MQQRVCEIRKGIKSKYVTTALAAQEELSDQGRMVLEYHERLAAWVKANMHKKRMSQTKLARELGIDQSAVSRALRLEGRAGFNAHEVEKLEKLFGERFGDDPSENVMQVAITNKSASHLVLDERISLGFSEMHAIQADVEIPPIRSPRYLNTPQKAMPIEDNSADAYAPKGAYAVVVDYFAFRLSPQVGDKVVVKRYHPILFRAGDISQSENTVRIVARGEDGRIILKACSSNPAIKDLDYNQNDKSVAISKLIIGWQMYEAY